MMSIPSLNYEYCQGVMQAGYSLGAGCCSGYLGQQGKCSQQGVRASTGKQPGAAPSLDHGSHLW